MGKIEKFSQDLSLWQKVKEPLNIKRKFTEGFSDKYKEQMEALKAADDELRKISGKLKENLKRAKISLKAGRFIDVAYFLGALNDIFKQYEDHHKGIAGQPEEIYKQFYSNVEQADLSSDVFKPGYFGKTAGIFDSAKRQMSQWQLERMYRATFKERKARIQELVNQADMLVRYTLDAFKDLGDYRVGGNIEAYIKRLGDVIKRHKIFEKSFAEKYGKYIAPLVTHVNNPPGQEPAEKTVPDLVTVPQAAAQQPANQQSVPDLEKGEVAVNETMQTTNVTRAGDPPKA